LIKTFCISWFLLILFFSQVSWATLETAEVLPSGVPNFIIEGQYSINSRFGNVGQAVKNFGATYHFGIGFTLGPVPFDFNATRRFGPSYATETSLVFETQYLARKWSAIIPMEASFLYGAAAKSDDIRRSATGKSTIYALRHGLVFSRFFKTHYMDLIPYMLYQGDVDFESKTKYAAIFNFGLAARPWFLDLVRFYLEGQVNIHRSIHAISMGLEVVLIPIVETKSY